MSDIAKKIMKEEVSKKTAAILLLNGHDEEGNESFAYFAVRLDNLETFKTAYQKGAINLEDYGVVLEHGQGVPPDEIKAKMTEEYNFNHEEAIPLS